MISILTSDNKFKIKIAYMLKKQFYQVLETLKSIEGRKWNSEEKVWEYPASPASAYALKQTGLNIVVDEQFREYLKSHLDGLSVLQSTEHPDYETCTPCFDHQKLCINLGMTRSACYYAHDMGTGKTKIAIDVMGLLKLEKVLIVCPKSVIPEWPRQFEKHGSCYSIRCTPLEKGNISKKRLKLAQTALEKGPTALVINYDAVWRSDFGKWVLNQEWDMVILDEIHRIRESRTKIGRFCHKLRPHASRRLGLSGTPMPNVPLDLWSQCRFLDPGLFGESFYAFRAKYAVMGGFEGKQVVAFRNLEELNKLFYSIAHRITKAEALDLPDTMDEERIIDLGPKATKIYEEIETSFVARVQEGEITVTNALVELLRFQQLTGGAAKFDDKPKPIEVDTEKANALADIFNDLPKTEPVVVFCRFHHDLDTIKAVASKTGRGCAELSGRVKQLQEWQDASNQPSIIAVQIKSGGEGVNLSRACYCVYYSLGFSPGNYDQSRSRVHRQGQTRKVTYYHLLATVNGRKSIDHKVYDALRRKKKVIQTILEEIKKDS